MNGTKQLCLDPARLNQALIQSVYREPTLNDILPKLANTYYMTITDASSGYHNLNIVKNAYI